MPASILNQLATSLNRRDEGPNRRLAQSIATNQNTVAVEELVQLLGHKNKNIQSDSIMVLSELAAINPSMVVPHTKILLQLLEHKSNRLVWGAMITLNGIASQFPDLMYEHLARILDAAERGSVITKDHAVQILVKLAAVGTYAGDAIILLVDQLKTAPLNQLPSYAEQTASVLQEKYKSEFVRVLQGRLPEVEQESKRKRIEKVLKKLL